MNGIRSRPRYIMIVLVINKNEEDQSKKEAAKVVPTLKTIFQTLKGS